MLLLTLIPPLSIFLLSLYAFFMTKPNHNLPPGTLGWPVIGETVKYMRARRVEGSSTRFFLDKTRRYGSSVFKASIFGEKIVFLSGQAGSKFLFSNEGKKVAVWWPASVCRLVETSLVTKVGEEAKSRRKMLMNFFNVDTLSSYVGIMDELTKRHLNLHWRDKEKLETYPTMKLYTFELACRLFMSITDPRLVSELAVHFNVFLKGLISLPINFPGTKFYRARKAADAIKKEFRTLMNQRRKELEEKMFSSSQDLLSHLLSDENGKSMPEIEILNNMLNLMFAGHDTSSSALTLVIKYLAELPNVCEKVLAEQKEIAASKRPGDSLGWDDIQKMRYSWNVISEVMRLNPPVAGSFREALVDITYEGYTIPKGWKLYWSAAVTHRDPNLHRAPASFDESRFEGSGPPPFSYVPFGGGPRMCLGKEFARLEMLVFLHNLVNNFEWNLVNPGERIVYDPMPTPVEGLPIRIRPLIIEA